MKDQQPRNLHEEEHTGTPGFVPGQPEMAFPPLLSLASLLDFSPDALLVIDATGTIVLLNAQLETLFGYDQGELIGQPLEVLLPERLRTAHIAQRLHYLSAPRARPMGIGLNLVGRRKDGGEFPVDISLRPLLIGQVLHVMGAIRDMTAQRLAEQERVQLTERLQRQDQLLNFSHDAILVRDPQSRIISWNRGAQELYGWKEHEAVGQVVHLLLSTRFPQPRETIEHDLEQTGHWDGDLIHRCQNGREVIVESRWVLVPNKEGTPTTLLEINRDVTERRRLEQIEQEARAETKARLDVLQLILDRLSTSIFLVQGPQARLLLANRSATELWGAEWKPDQPMKDFLEQQHVRLFTEDGRPLPSEASAIGRAMTLGEPVLHAQLVLHRPDGVSLPVLVDVIPLDLLHSFHRLPASMAKILASSERVVLVVHQDVTALKEAEALKDQFISLATHELRTPVTVMAGYADLLLKQSKGEERNERQQCKLRAIKEAALHLAKLTEDVLDVTRVQAGQFQLRRSSTELVTLTRQVVEQLQTTTDHHQLSIQTALAHLWAFVDAFRVEQVLSNLLTNAIKYSPQGGSIEVAIGKDEETSEARFSVRDHGMGIPQEQQAHLFGRFVRAENVQTARIPGTGLGLYLCRELVERHGGHIWFQSEEHPGSTFFFTFPCDDREQREKTLS
jgi:PAS domain S-box-containing protein